MVTQNNQDTIKRRYLTIKNNTIYKTFIGDGAFIEIKKPIQLKQKELNIYHILDIKEL